MCSNLKSQSILADFNIDQSNGQVLLAWTIKSGSVCNGMQIFRSQDSLEYELIEDIQGVCGDLSSPVSYTFTDTEPELNTTNFYKISFGGTQESNVLSIEVYKILNNSYLLKPNPVTGISDLYFNNDNQHELVLKVYGDFGDLIYTDTTNNTKFVLDRSFFSSGMYYFSLENLNNRNVINGKALFLNP
tara:strand:- start:56 stop:619 length:564 start_codon:yes stop_codon:yes gene_type:complete